MSNYRETLESIELPADFANALQPMTETGEPTETLADAAAAFDHLWDVTGVRISVDQMYQPERTRHTVEFNDRVEYLPCVLDALIAGLIVDPTVAVIRSKPPTGEAVINITLTEDGIDVAPSSAVFSIGMSASDTENPEMSVSQLEKSDSAVMASCSYINAFPQPAAFDEWKDGISDAHVVRVGDEELLAFARWAAQDWVTGPDRDGRDQ